MRSKVENSSFAFSQRTGSIEVTAQPFYLDQQSVPEDSHFVWAYKIKIENLGIEPVQLLTRHWQITDSNGCMREVHGDGVVGEQPILKPGESFQYSSFAALPTTSGFMMGSYEMQNVGADGRFEINIPPFSLDSPNQLAYPN